MKTDQDIDQTFKSNFFMQVVLAGDHGVGKSFLLNRYVRQEIPSVVHPTIGVEFGIKVTKLPSGQKIKTHIWDTAGQERYRSIIQTHYKKAVGALLVYDVTREKTFENLNKWVQDLRNIAEQDIQIVLVGNKTDIVEKNPELRKVLREKAVNFAQENNLVYEETSAVTSSNVDKAFETLLQYNKDQWKDNRGRQNLMLNQNQEDNGQKSKCC